MKQVSDDCLITAVAINVSVSNSSICFMPLQSLLIIFLQTGANCVWRFFGPSPQKKFRWAILMEPHPITPIPAFGQYMRGLNVNAVLVTARKKGHYTIYDGSLAHCNNCFYPKRAGQTHILLKTEPVCYK